jgi:hypothetical protein
MARALRTVLGILLLMCSLGTQTYAQERDDMKSPEKREAESAARRRDKTIDDLAHKKGISRDEAEKQLDQVQERFSSGALVEKKQKPPGFDVTKAAPFENPPEVPPQPGSVHLNDESPAHPDKAGKSVLTPDTSSTKDFPVVRLSRKTSPVEHPDPTASSADQKQSTEKETCDEAGGEAHEHEKHAYHACENVQPQAARDKCEEDMKSSKR